MFLNINCLDVLLMNLGERVVGGIPSAGEGNILWMVKSGENQVLSGLCRKENFICLLLCS